MFRLNNKTRKYQTPSVKVTQMALESNFCQTGLRLNAQVDELRNINAEKGTDGKTIEPMYFEF